MRGLIGLAVAASVTEDPVLADAHLGMEGPTQIDQRLVVAAPKDGKVTTLASAPLGVMSSESDLLFRALWRVDPAAGTLQVDAPPDDCKGARARLDAYWAPKKRATKDALVARAMDSERRAGLARVEAVCRAAGAHRFR